MARLEAISTCWLGAVLVILPGCAATREVSSIYPPPDFKIELQYSVIDEAQTQVKRRAVVFADGLVILREADRTLRSSSGLVELPVFDKLCVYRMDWRSIRSLSRELARERAKDVEQPIHDDAQGAVHEIDFDLTYAGNRVDVVLTNRAVGLMNLILRKVDSFLPEGHGFTLPGSMGEADERRVQDVPPVKDQVQGALGYHQAWLRENPTDPALLLDTFALACAAPDWAVAERCLAKVDSEDPAVRAGFAEILSGAKARAGVPRR